MKSYPEVQKENPWGSILQVVAYCDPLRKTAQLRRGSTYGK